MEKEKPTRYTIPIKRKIIKPKESYFPQTQ